MSFFWNVVAVGSGFVVGAAWYCAKVADKLRANENTVSNEEYDRVIQRNVEQGWTLYALDLKIAEYRTKKGSTYQKVANELDEIMYPDGTEEW